MPFTSPFFFYYSSQGYIKSGGGNLVMVLLMQDIRLLVPILRAPHLKRSGLPKVHTRWTPSLVINIELYSNPFFVAGNWGF